MKKECGVTGRKVAEGEWCNLIGQAPLKFKEVEKESVMC
jgi:hypothetical protein